MRGRRQSNAQAWKGQVWYWDRQPLPWKLFYRCELGEYTLLELKRRTAKAELPEVYTVDMREELQKGNRSILSDRLHELMEDRLKKKEQIILFLNRRGYAGFLSCRSCGYVVKCPHCDVSLAVHNNGKMVCHYCGYEEPVAKKLPVLRLPSYRRFSRRNTAD